MKLAHPIVDRHTDAILVVFENDECTLVPIGIMTALWPRSVPSETWNKLPRVMVATRPTADIVVM